MTGMERREHILNSLRHSAVPISGTALANEFSVSRQVIVQDIAVVRASGYDIISTNKGYLLKQGTVHKRVIKFINTDGCMEQKMNTIVDLGGSILDIFVYHAVYGKLIANLDLRSRRDIQAFLHEYEKDSDNPVKAFTSGTYYHTISADSEEILDLIETALHK